MGDEGLPTLIGRMFEAVDAPERWGAVIDGICDLVGGTGSVAFVMDGMEVAWHALTRLDPADLQRFQEYGYEDEWLKRRWLLPTRGAFIGSEAITLEELRKTRYYADFLTPCETVHSCGIMLSNGQSRIGCMTIFRPEQAEAFDRPERELLATVTPHLLRAFDLSTRFQGLRHELSAAQGCLDGLSQGLILLGADQRILSMNAAAEDILRQGTSLRALQGRVTAASASDAEALRRSLSQACGKARHGGSLALGHPADGGVLRIMIVPLDEASGLARWATETRACMILKRGSEAAHIPAGLLRQTFGLTEREAMLAAHLRKAAISTPLPTGINFRSIRCGPTCGRCSKRPGRTARPNLCGCWPAFRCSYSASADNRRTNSA